MNLKYTEQAEKDLAKFDNPDQILIVKKIHYLLENFDILKKTQKIKELKGTTHKGLYRFKIAKKLRAIFYIKDNEITLLVLRIGLRKNIYKK